MLCLATIFKAVLLLKHNIVCVAASYVVLSSHVIYNCGISFLFHSTMVYRSVNYICVYCTNSDYTWYVYHLQCLAFRYYKSNYTKNFDITQTYNYNVCSKTPAYIICTILISVTIIKQKFNTHTDSYIDMQLYG